MKSIPWRVPERTQRQITEIMAVEGRTNKSALLTEVIAEKWQRTHAQLHFDLAQQETGVCPWCGWDAGKTTTE